MISSLLHAALLGFLPMALVVNEGHTRALSVFHASLAPAHSDAAAQMEPSPGETVMGKQDASLRSVEVQNGPQKPVPRTAPLIADGDSMDYDHKDNQAQRKKSLLQPPQKPEYRPGLKVRPNPSKHRQALPEPVRSPLAEGDKTHPLPLIEKQVVVTSPASTSLRHQGERGNRSHAELAVGTRNGFAQDTRLIAKAYGSRLSKRLEPLLRKEAAARRWERMKIDLWIRVDESGQVDLKVEAPKVSARIRKIVQRLARKVASDMPIPENLRGKQWPPVVQPVIFG